MRPRNKYEKRVAELNATLSEDISVKDFEWAKKETFSPDVTMGSADYVYFTICSNMAEFEVRRLYRLYRFDDKSTSHFFVTEIMREFIDGDRKTYFSKKRWGMGCSSFDCFSLNSDIELKSNEANYACNRLSWMMDYSIGSRICSEGKRIKCEKRDCIELGRMVKNNPVAETMYKENNPMFGYLMYRPRLKDVCRAYTLAKRHGFVFDSYTIPLWLDMVEAIIYCKKDFHNPVYIAPKDLTATHDRFIRMMHRRREEEAIIRKNRKAEQKAKRELDYGKIYEKNRKRFFGMVLKKGSLTISVLPNIEAFKDMADHFHNCVYSNEYWNLKTHPQSLIMVACIGGNKAELIEVRLDTYKVQQCFGKHNQLTNYHKRIYGFVERNMETIKAYNENKLRIKKAA